MTLTSSRGVVAPVVATVVGGLLLGTAVLVPTTGGLRAPREVSDEVAQQQMRDFADATWASTGLEGRMARPDVPATPPPPPDLSSSSLVECMQEAGYRLSSWSGGPGLGLVLMNEAVSAEAPPDAEQLAWYVCVVTTMPDPRATGELTTPEQQLFEYHFQTMHVIPCLEGNGVSGRWDDFPSEPIGFRISAFDLIDDLLEEAQVTRLIRLCGPEYALDP